MYCDVCPPLPPPRRLIFCYPVYVSSLYCDVHIPPVSAVSLILSVYIVMLLSAVLLPCLCWLSTLRCSILHLSAAVLFTLTACIVMFVPFCLRCSPVLTLYVHISSVSPGCSPVIDNCVHCDAYPPLLSINAVVIIGILQLNVRVPFKTFYILPTSANPYVDINYHINVCDILVLHSYNFFPILVHFYNLSYFKLLLV